MRGFGSSLEQISNKLLPAEAAVEVVKPGHRVFVGTACAAPFTLVEALERRKPTPPDVELFHFLTSGLEPLWVERQSSYRHRCFFVGSDVRALVHSGQAEYVPISLTQIPHLTATGRIRTDVALVQVSTPDEHGFVSLGISVDIAMSVLRYAKTIVAEINPFMPRTLGDTFLHVDRIDRFVRVERPLAEYAHQPADTVTECIARYVAEIIEDGATLHVALGRIPNETLKHLHNRRDLGIHSNVITDPVLDLIEQGVITGRHKTLHPGKIVTSFCIGSRRLYEYLHDNPLFEFRPIEYVADPQVVAQNYKMASLTQALVIDLTGQVCADQFRGEFYGGVSTLPDFHRGAARAREGKPIVCLTSTTDDGKESRIRPALLAGEGVDAGTRGCALCGDRVRYCLPVWQIREGASLGPNRARASRLPRKSSRRGQAPVARACRPQAGRRPRLPRRGGAVVTLKSGSKVMIRPARGSDVQSMQVMFHRMSSEDVYMRFFRRVSALTYEEAQRLCNVDFEKDVAFVAVAVPARTRRLSAPAPIS